MTTIELTQEQLKVLATSNGDVVLTNHKGQAVGYVSPPLTAEEVRMLEQRADSDGPWQTTPEVLAHLKSLETA